MIKRTQVTFICDRCKKEITYNEKGCTDEDIVNKNQCWHISLATGGYGSQFDGLKPKFDLCDDCLHELLKEWGRLEDLYEEY